MRQLYPGLTIMLACLLAYLKLGGLSSPHVPAVGRLSEKRGVSSPRWQESSRETGRVHPPLHGMSNLKRRTGRCFMRCTACRSFEVVFAFTAQVILISEDQFEELKSLSCTRIKVPALRVRRADIETRPKLGRIETRWVFRLRVFTHALVFQHR